MPLKLNEIIELKIEKLVSGGRGIGFSGGADGGADGGASSIPIFVEDAAPGDVVEIQITKRKKSFAEARVVRIVEPSSIRTQPRCKHFGVCGGCSWQFLPYEEQLKWKEQFVRETLEHVGGFRDIVVEPIVANGGDGTSGGAGANSHGGAQEPWFYRNKMEWSFDAKSGKTGDQKTGIDATAGTIDAGLHVRGRWHDVVHIEECFLQSEKSLEIFKVIREFFQHENIEHATTSSPIKVPRSVFVREGKRTGEMMVVLNFENSNDTKIDQKNHLKNVNKNADEPEYINTNLIRDFTNILTQQFPEIVSIAVGNKIIFGKSAYREKLIVHGREILFDIRPTAFFQPNPMMAEKIYECVAEWSDMNGGGDEDGDSDEDHAGGEILDLFCGTGTIGIVLAGIGAKNIIGIDAEESAIESAKSNAELNGFSNIQFHAGMVQQILPTLFKEKDFVGSSFRRPSIIVMDPPRVGVAPKALESVIAIQPRRIIYISCNPASFARDARVLAENGYHLEKVRPFDQFPQTAHIEIVGSFSFHQQ